MLGARWADAWMNGGRHDTTLACNGPSQKGSVMSGVGLEGQFHYDFFLPIQFLRKFLSFPWSLWYGC